MHVQPSPLDPAPPSDDALNDAGRRAIHAVRERARTHQDRVDAEIAAWTAGRDGADAAVSAFTLALAAASVAVHFHPDRQDRRGRRVIDGLISDGRYESQFVTGLSAGSRTAHPGGARDDWERDLFGGAYHDPPVPASDRPKYGALTLHHTGDGPAPRFGSCRIVLRPEVTARCTFTVGDSHLRPERRATADALAAVVAAALAGDVPPGPADDVAALSSWIEALRAPAPDPASLPHGRSLDAYIEAQIHGELRLDRDVAEIVADPSFRGGEVGDALERLGRRSGAPIRWHRGFVLGIDAIPDDVRGPEMPAVGRRVARDGVVDAAAIGAAEAAFEVDPGAWSELGAPDDVRQRLKQLWHVLVARGADGR